VQQLGVRVDPLAAEKDLQVAEHVGDHVADQNQPGNAHDDLLAHRRLVKAETLIQLDGDRYPHSRSLAFTARSPLYTRGAAGASTGSQAPGIATAGARALP